MRTRLGSILTVAPLWVLLCASPTLAQHHGLPHDIPDFCATPTIWTVASGSWTDAAIWSGGRMPGANDVVVVSQSTSVTYGIVSDAALACLGLDGSLRFQTGVNTRLTVGTLMVLEGGELEVGRAGAPVDAAVVAEIVIANQPLTPAVDPGEFGTGLLAFGRVTMHGATANPTFARVALEPRAGQTTMTLSAATDSWRIGDRIVRVSRSVDGVAWEAAGTVTLPGQPSGLWAFAVDERRIGIALGFNNRHMKWFTASSFAELKQSDSQLPLMHQSEEAEFFVRDAALTCIRPIFDFERQKPMLLATSTERLWGGSGKK